MNRRTIAAVSLLTGVLAAGTAGAGEYKDRAKDAWLDGKLETIYMLNRNLNNFTIDTEVTNGVAYLKGTVESGVDRALAEELALGIDGITQVRNELEIDRDYKKREIPARAKLDEMDDEMEEMGDEVKEEYGEMKAELDDDMDDDRSFLQWFDDITTTAAVKSRLMAEWNVTALEIDVDTKNNIVHLRGEVDSEAEADLAEQIARNTDDVRNVHNHLVVDVD